MNKTDFAIFGATPAFQQSLPVGQLYFPSWERYETAMRGIFDRTYYTNQGPLVRQLEEKLQQYLGVRHAICVTNATIGLMMAADALNLKGKVILPAFTFVASAQSLSWCGLEPVFCDVDAITHQITPANVEPLLDDTIAAIMGVNLWGGACDPESLTRLGSKHGLPVYFDSAHGFGCKIGDRAIGNFGNTEVFSFHATKVLNATEGGCLCTNDDDLAGKFRNIRSSYGAGRPVEVVKTSNGRMSEAQAAIALMSLEDFPENQRQNERLFLKYESLLSLVPGIRIVRPIGVTLSNYQYVVCEVEPEVFGISRDALLTVLNAENIFARRYFYPGIHRTVEYSERWNKSGRNIPVTDRLNEIVFQLPIGARVNLGDVERICEIIAKIQKDHCLFQKELEGNR